MTMECLFATLLVNETGKEINEQNLTRVLYAAGCPVQESRIKAMVAALERIDLGDIEPVDPGTGIPGTGERSTGGILDRPEGLVTDGVVGEADQVEDRDWSGE